MESSSGESFLWTDVSNDSNNSENMSLESNEAHKSETDNNTGSKRKKSDPCFENQHNSKKIHKAGKKRKVSISSNDFQSEKKRIKLEPESDLDLRKKKKLEKDLEEKNGSHDSDEYDEFYLNKKVKEEQMSLTEKKYKNSPCNSKEMESYLNLKVKEEQVSEIESEPVKSKKKKKKHKHSSLISDNDSEIIMESIHLNNITIDNESTACANDTNDDDVKNYIIEEKFTAEDTVVEKRKKKKSKKNTQVNSTSCNNSENVDDISKPYVNEEQNETDISLQPNDFTCNNIVSSTIINMSTIETKDRQPIHKVDSIAEEISHGQEYHRSLKISDRIQFENDESSSREITLNKLSLKIQQFLKTHSQLQVASNIHDNCTLTEDDEIWILRFPDEMDLQKLINTKLTLEGKHKIKIDGQTYDGVLNKHLNKITLLANQHDHMSGANFHVKGYVSYHKRMPKVHIPDNITMVNNQTNFIPLPETKQRHPLFGANFKKAIKIPTAVAKRLEAAKIRQSDDSFKTSITKKHKKEKKKSIEIKVEENCRTELEPSKKKKKRKHSQDDSAPPRKRKHMQHGPDSTEVWESEKAIEENLFNF